MDNFDWIAIIMGMFIVLWFILSIFLRCASALVIAAIISLVLLMLKLPPVGVFRHESSGNLLAYSVFFLFLIGIVLVYVCCSAFTDSRKTPISIDSNDFCSQPEVISSSYRYD